jgi:hypothetical protein
MRRTLIKIHENVHEPATYRMSQTILTWRSGFDADAIRSQRPVYAGYKACHRAELNGIWSSSFALLTHRPATTAQMDMLGWAALPHRGSLFWNRHHLQSDLQFLNKIKR